MRAHAGHERWRMDFVLPWVAAGRLSEIGPGWGVFALLALDAGFDVTGIEMDERCCAYLRDAARRRGGPDRRARARARRGPDRRRSIAAVARHRARAPAVRAGRRPRPSGWSPAGCSSSPRRTPARSASGCCGSRWPHVDAPRHLYLHPRAGARPGGRGARARARRAGQRRSRHARLERVRLDARAAPRARRRRRPRPGAGRRRRRPARRGRSSARPAAARPTPPSSESRLP